MFLYLFNGSLVANLLYIHPDNPQFRLISQVVDCLNNDGVIVLPTDSGYTLATKIDNKKGQDKMCIIKQTNENHLFALLCADLSSIAQYARVDNSCYRLLKSVLPGGYTFILKAAQHLPRRLMQNKRKTIGIRVPSCKIASAILSELNEPLIVSSLTLSEIDDIHDVDTFYEHTKHQVDIFIHGGSITVESSSVVDLSEGFPATIIRKGQGDTSFFE